MKTVLKNSASQLIVASHPKGQMFTKKLAPFNPFREQLQTGFIAYCLLGMKMFISPARIKLNSSTFEYREASITVTLQPRVDIVHSLADGKYCCMPIHSIS